MEGFYRHKDGGTRKLKESIISGKLTLPTRQEAGWDRILIKQITSLVLTRKFQFDWFKILLLGEAETAIRLGIKS